ncbi:MAG: cysteine hydrolase family protein [Armatimonadota bacterium]
MMNLGTLTDPSHTALIVVDLQNDYCSSLGAYGQAGTDLSMMPAVIARAARLIDAARDSGVLVIWLQQTSLRGGLSAAPSSLRSRDGYLARERCIDGTFGHAFVGPLAPRPEEPVIKKLRSSGFVGTMLDLLLDANGIRTCVLIGVGTEGCVEATARSAADHNYQPVIVEDCVASTRMDLHGHSISVMRTRARSTISDELIRSWRTSPFADGTRPGVALRVHASLDEIVRPQHSALVVAARAGTNPETAPLIEALVRSARQAGVLVVRLCPRDRRSALEAQAGQNELIVETFRPDGFEGSPLHLLLDERGIHTVVLAGAETQGEVESTARGAAHRNYYVVCVEDAVTTADRRLQDAALAIMRQRYDVAPAARLAAIWTGAKVGAE